MPEPVFPLQEGDLLQPRETANGDVNLEGDVRTVPNACGLYQSAPGAPFSVSCTVGGSPTLFHLNAGENGTITVKTPSVVLGFLSGKMLKAEGNGYLRVVGGAHLIEGFQGNLQIYHDPNQVLVGAPILDPYVPIYAVIRMNPPSPYSP